MANHARPSLLGDQEPEKNEDLDQKELIWGYDKVQELLLEKYEKNQETDIFEVIDNLISQSIDLYSAIAFRGGSRFMVDVYSGIIRDDGRYEKMFQSLLHDVCSALTLLQDQNEGSKDIAIFILEAAKGRYEDTLIE